MSCLDARHAAVDSSYACLRVRDAPDIGDSEAFRTRLASQYRRSAPPQMALVASRCLTASRAPTGPQTPKRTIPLRTEPAA